MSVEVGDYVALIADTKVFCRPGDKKLLLLSNPISIQISQVDVGRFGFFEKKDRVCTCKCLLEDGSVIEMLVADRDLVLDETGPQRHRQ